MVRIPKKNCIRGHKFTPANTAMVKLTTGHIVRACKLCRSARDTLRYKTNPAYQARARFRGRMRWLEKHG